MGAVRMRVRTADKNITIIHTPVHQLMPCEAKICVLVRNKSIIKMFLTSNHCFQLKYKSSIHNTAFSSKKSSYLNREKSAQIKHRLQAKTVQNSFKQICDWILMWEATGDGLFTGGSFIMDYGLLFYTEVMV